MKKRRISLLLMLIGSSGVFASSEGGAAKPAALRIQPLGDKTEFLDHWYVCGPFEYQGSDEVKARWARTNPTLPTPQEFFTEHDKTKEGVVGWWETRIEEQDMPSQDPQTKQLRVSKANFALRRIRLLLLKSSSGSVG